jgi:light-regulated signal transduction histidine kinase (bacteriophytochrome)
LASAIEECQAQVTCDPLPAVIASPVHLLQLFQNLVGNAIKYRGETAPVIHVSAVADGGKWVFSVKDNGIGIEPQHTTRIFGLFKRLHGRDRYSGTGLGLAICQKIVERYGGRIWVESEVGKGSTFLFTWPRADRR